MADEARAECPVCLRCICVSASGSIRTHGPHSSRCPGSNSAAHVSSTISQAPNHLLVWRHVVLLPLPPSACHRLVSLLFAAYPSGPIRTHGPRSSRCPGSNSAAHVSSTISQGAQPPTNVEARGPSSPPPICLLQTHVSIVRRLPKGSRRLASEKLCSLLKDVVATNSLASWEKLLSFAPSCLYSLRRGSKCWSLASQINRQLD